MSTIPRTTEHRTLTLFLAGELDHHQAQITSAEIRNLIDENLPKELVLDFSGVTFSDSSGIAILLRAKRAMGQLEGDLRITNVPPQPLRLFQAAGLDKQFCFSPSAK